MIIPEQRTGQRLLAYLATAVQLALIVIVVKAFAIEQQEHFLPVVGVATMGFLIHWWLPSNFRVPFFNVLSLGTIAMVLGWPNAGWVLGIGLGLVTVCLLPIPWRYRVLALLIASIVLASYRLDQAERFWPVLASLFMFRLIVFLFETRHATTRPPTGLTIAYFMPLQNISFLFFPILDYKTWCESYRPATSWELAQSGIRMMVRGLTHLLLYRVIKYFLLPSPHELGDAPHVLLFLVLNYALYLRVSGTFHLITGIFHLFGFGMPRTNENYFLASSFTDIWRRINIYWRDFMMKVFFFPAFFRMRGLGNRGAATLAILFVFLATWLLHVYQVFWMTRNLQFRIFDGFLWLCAGLLVVVNMQFDLSRAGKGRVGAKAVTLGSALRRALQVAGTFLVVSFFWACWNTPQVVPFLRALPLTTPAGIRGLAQAAGWIIGAIAIGVAVQLILPWLRSRQSWLFSTTPAVAAFRTTGILVALLAMLGPWTEQILSPRQSGMLLALRQQSSSPVEAAQAVSGYYEEMSRVHAPAGAWASLLEGKPTVPPATHYAEMSRPSDPLLEREITPNFSGMIDGAVVNTNRFAMRDRLDRSLKKPDGVCRLALVGSSVIMGYGVGDEQTFARLLEADLNRTEAGGRKIEVLNFGTGRSYALQRRELMSRKVFGFEPDAIYWFAHQDELIGTLNHVTSLIDKREPMPSPKLTEIVREAGISEHTKGLVIQALLQPHTKRIVSAVYREVVRDCREKGILPVWVYLPMPGVVEISLKSDEIAALAEEAGFLVLNLAHWADGHPPSELIKGERDYHPNIKGHELIAAKLAAALRSQSKYLPACALRKLN
jgi:hypothetical protein